jgi:nitroreductase/FMN reductase [NAD(P)H]
VARAPARPLRDRARRPPRGLTGDDRAYDRRRHALQPYPEQRDPARGGVDAGYGWSEDKARQYADPQRTGFGAFVRRKGFSLD